MTTSRTDQLIDTWDRLTTSVNSPPLRTATPRSVHAPLGAALVGAIVLAAVLVQGRLGIAAPGPTTATATPTRTPSAPVAPATPPQVPSTCQPTEPIHPFVAPAGSAAPVRPPQDLDAEWFGSARLWTLLRHGGEIWYGLPREAAGLGQKTFWWSADFDVNRERQPEISRSEER